MATQVDTGTTRQSLHGIEIDVETRGSGRDIIYLGSGMWFADESAFLARLAGLGRVIAPIAPGFGDATPTTKCSTVDDIAYLCLDLIDAMKLKNVLLVGASFGGWVAAEIAIKNCRSIAGLVLIDALGIKVGDRETRDIADLYGRDDATLRSLAYVDPSIFVSDVKAIDDIELRRRMRARESLARYGWQPFMHNPKLRQRLHRVEAPTQVIWGARDGIVSPAYGRAYAAAIPGARFEEIAGAAHFPQVEQPDATFGAIKTFAGGLAARA